jgi:hypothetical protein
MPPNRANAHRCVRIRPFVERRHAAPRDAPICAKAALELRPSMAATVLLNDGRGKARFSACPE